MKAAITILLVMTSLSLAGAGTDIADIFGNSVFSDREIKAAVDPGAPIDSISAAIVSLYNESGYFQTSLKLEIVNEARLIVTIEEGDPTIIGSVEVSISPDSLNAFDDIIGEMEGETATRDNLDLLAYEIVSRLSDRGMPFAGAEWRGFILEDGNKLKADLKILPGPVCSLRRFVFEGISRTRPETIRRRITPGEGEPYSESGLGDSQRRIGRMPYLEINAPFEVALAGGDDSCDVIYYLRELPSTRFDGAAGYAGSDNRDEFVGRLDLVFGDILGTGRSFGLNWKKKDPESSELLISYTEPYLCGSRFDSRLEVYQADRDTLFLETGGSLRFDFHFSIVMSASFSFGLRMVEPEIQTSGMPAVTSSTGRSIAAGFEYDNTDLPENPRAGYQLGSDIEYRYRSSRNAAAESVPLTRITSIGFDGAQYAGISKRLVLALLLSGWGVVDSDGDVPPDELRYIGGIDNLRGYVEDRFPAYRYGIASFEMRILAGRKSRAYMFGDFGAISGSKPRANKYRFEPGYGFGLISPTALGLFKVEIGWGRAGFPSDAVLNFGLAGGF